MLRKELFKGKEGMGLGWLKIDGIPLTQTIKAHSKRSKLNSPDLLKN